MADSVVNAAAHRREPTAAELQAAASELKELSREAADLLYRQEAAPLHCAMGRIYGERLGDARSAAICFQNAFRIDATHRTAIEAVPWPTPHPCPLPQGEREYASRLAHRFFLARASTRAARFASARHRHQ